MFDRQSFFKNKILEQRYTAILKNTSLPGMQLPGKAEISTLQLVLHATSKSSSTEKNRSYSMLIRLNMKF